MEQQHQEEEEEEVITMTAAPVVESAASQKHDDDERPSRQQKKNPLHDNHNKPQHSFLRSLYLSSLGWIFLSAFWSYYTQFPGLLSRAGVEPVHRFLPYTHSWMRKHVVVPWNMDVDDLCELAAVMGMIVSCVLASSGRCCRRNQQHASLYLVATGLYSFLVSTGGTFYSFQWDVLLLETGIVTALCYADWTVFNSSSSSFTNTIQAWPLRFLLFKLMWMSGVVKIQADCPTWKNLTALEYHLATQCLPGRWLAWWMHQWHPLLLRVGVAVTLWVEIPVTLLLLCPSVAWRRVGACWQLLLQCMILLTGNYNFFNLLTMALCLPCMERDDDDDDDVGVDDNNANDGTTTQKRKNKNAFPWHHILLWAYLAWSFQKMFRFEKVPPAKSVWHDGSISLQLTKRDCDWLSGWVVPVATLVTMGFVVQATAAKHKESSSKTLLLLVVVRSWLHAAVCILVIGVIAVPMCSLTPKLQRRSFPGYRLLFAPLWQQYARPHGLANGYGLFRRMTGVGKLPPYMNDVQGWAGQPPSVVARPEIVLEGVFEEGSSSSSSETEEESWHELEFRWKPGDVRAMPRQVAPHQPRLDWQMWFAALGSPQQNMWLQNLVQKLLDDCGPVKHLVGDPILNGERRLTKLRAKLYHYDFTRMDYEWNRGIPGVQIIVNTTTRSVMEKRGWLPAWIRAVVAQPDPVWHRTYVRPYLGIIEQNDTALAKRLNMYKYPSECLTAEDRCQMAPSVWCKLACTIRAHKLHLLPVALLVSSVLLSLTRRTRSHHTETSKGHS